MTRTVLISMGALIAGALGGVAIALASAGDTEAARVQGVNAGNHASSAIAARIIRDGSSRGFRAGVASGRRRFPPVTQTETKVMTVTRQGHIPFCTDFIEVCHLVLSRHPQAAA